MAISFTKIPSLSWLTFATVIIEAHSVTQLLIIIEINHHLLYARHPALFCLYLICFIYHVDLFNLQYLNLPDHKHLIENPFAASKWSPCKTSIFCNLRPSNIFFWIRSHQILYFYQNHTFQTYFYLILLFIFIKSVFCPYKQYIIGTFWKN